MIERRILGTMLVVALASCSSDKRSKPVEVEKSAQTHTNALPSTPATGSGSGVPEKPWLSDDVTDQIVTKDGDLGPAFADVVLGGPVPPEAVRSKIAGLARANGIKLDLEIVDAKVTAVRFDVTYGGCCGYEAADKLAHRFGRPFMQSTLDGPKEWSNDWAWVKDVHIRVRVRVNRVAVRWEPTLKTFGEYLDRADALIGSEVTAMRNSLGDRVIEMEAGTKYFVELPYQLRGYLSDLVKLEERVDLGFVVIAENGRVREVRLPIEGREDPDQDYKVALKKRWGAPKVQKSEDSETSTWQTKTRIATAQDSMLVIRAIP